MVKGMLIMMIMSLMTNIIEKQRNEKRINRIYKYLMRVISGRMILEPVKGTSHRPGFIMDSIMRAADSLFIKFIRRFKKTMDSMGE